MSISLQVENYLKNIYLLEARYPQVPTTVLAERLGVSPPSVTGMIHKLVRLGLLVHEPYKGISLTAQGRAAALQIVRVHRLWELYLVEALEVPWDQAHVEAERLEHALSDELATRIDEKLGHPAFDPHGHPIPTPDGRVPPCSGQPLTELSPGQAGTISQICDDTPELLRYLGDLGAYPGERITVLEVAPFNGPIHVRIDGTEQVLGREAAEHVVVDHTILQWTADGRPVTDLEKHRDETGRRRQDEEDSDP